MLRRRGFNLRHVALVGSESSAENIKKRLSSAGWSGYQIVLTLTRTDAESLQTLEVCEVDEVWLALPFSQGHRIKDVMPAIRHRTATIRFVPDMFTLRLVNLGITDILGMPMYDLSATPMIGLNKVIKWVECKL